MIAEIIITEVEGSIVRQFILTTDANVLHSMLASMPGGQVGGRGIVTDKNSDSLIVTPLVDALRQTEREPVPTVRCRMCGHECISLGSESGQDWWRCEECNWVSGRMVGTGKGDSG